MGFVSNLGIKSDNFRPVTLSIALVINLIL
jgi:hypothetical protein